MIDKENLIQLLKGIQPMRPEVVGFIMILEEENVTHEFIANLINSISSAINSTNSVFAQKELNRVKIYLNRLKEKEELDNLENKNIENLFDKI